MQFKLLAVMMDRSYFDNNVDIRVSNVPLTFNRDIIVIKTNTNIVLNERIGQM